ncbi:MAG: methionyl-tRNA formyltransferase [Actinobacteria bacterium]|nr:methionyl-tRNA formyltransferase [Actinomycetota bacterium]
MEYVFAGTDEFSLELLKNLSTSYKDPSCILTQKPKPRGRGLKILPVPVAKFAVEKNIPYLEIGSFEELKQEIDHLDLARILVVCSFGLYIPSWFTERFDWTLNFHPSLVPEYRGAAPIQRALLDGRKETGVSIIEVSAEMDAGRIYDYVKVQIDEDDNYETLSKKLLEAGTPLLVKVLKDISNGKINLKEQSGEVILAPKITKEELWIDWAQPAQKIKNKIRAFSPKPGARTRFRGKMLKILKAEVIEGTSGNPGEIVSVGKEGLIIGTSDGFLKVEKVQPENSRVMDAFEFVNGYRVQAGEMLM